MAAPCPVLAQGSGSLPSKPSTQTGEIGLPVAQGHSYKEFNSQGQIWTIAQDLRGLMYIGVSGGDLIEYDGVTWRKTSTGSDTVRSLALDETGRLWLGCNGTFGYVEADAKGSLRFVSLLDKVPENERQFTDIWQTLVTPQGVFFRSYEKLFRWSGNTIHVWSRGDRDRYQALSAVRGHIYTAQNGIGLEEVVGDELRPVAEATPTRTPQNYFCIPTMRNVSSSVSGKVF
jgi:hypothetical protein